MTTKLHLPALLAIASAHEVARQNAANISRTERADSAEQEVVHKTIMESLNNSMRVLAEDALAKEGLQ